MNRLFSVRTVFGVLLMASLIMGGCLGSREWTYPPPPDKTYLEVSTSQKIQANLVVVPLEDKRGNGVKEEYWKAAVPLVPHGVTAYDRPETIPNPERVDDVDFDPPRDFMRALVEEVKRSDLFSSVTYAESPDSASGDVVLRGQLHSTRWERRITTYLFGPFGTMFWMLGLPMGNTTTEVSLDMQLTPSGEPANVLWSFAMEFEGREVDGLYYGLEDSVRSYPVALQDALRDVIRDLADKAPARVKRFLSTPES